MRNIIALTVVLFIGCGTKAIELGKLSPYLEKELAPRWVSVDVSERKAPVHKLQPEDKWEPFLYITGLTCDGIAPPCKDCFRNPARYRISLVISRKKLAMDDSSQITVYGDGDMGFEIASFNSAYVCVYGQEKGTQMEAHLRTLAKEFRERVEDLVKRY